MKTSRLTTSRKASVLKMENAVACRLVVKLEAAVRRREIVGQHRHGRLDSGPEPRLSLHGGSNVCSQTNQR